MDFCAHLFTLVDYGCYRVCSYCSASSGMIIGWGNNIKTDVLGAWSEVVARNKV